MTALRFLRVGDVGREHPVVMTADNRCFDLRPLGADVDEHFLAAEGIAATRRALEAGELVETSIAGRRIGPPIARPPALYCIGYNYAAHAAEAASETPPDPVVLAKNPHTVVGPHDTLLLPPNSTKTDWEVEIGIVIGATARYLPDPEAARACIAGLVTSNDVSERDYQLGDAGGQYTKGKSCETFNPLGPWLVPLEDIPDLGALRLTSWVNGEQRQSARASEMVFDVFELVHRISQYFVLEPGDLINSGTPAGVAFGGGFPYLTDDDLVEAEVSGLGRQAVVCARASV